MALSQEQPPDEFVFRHYWGTKNKKFTDYTVNFKEMIQWQDNGTIRKVRALLDGDEETLFSWRMVAPHDEDESEPSRKELADGDAEHPGTQSTTLKERAEGDAGHPETKASKISPSGLKRLKGMIKEKTGAGASGDQEGSICGNSEHSKKKTSHCKADESHKNADWWQSSSWGWKW